MKIPRHNIIWNMTKKCNFRCSYCYFPHDDTPVRNPLDVEKIMKFLRSTDRTWVVGMTGGEPLIYPGFIDICKRLTEEHMIGVDTNLSLSNTVARFAETIDPERVQDLYVSLHIEERERRNGVDSFIDNVLLLKQKGFKVIVNYVIHPDLMERYPKDVEFYAERGVTITPRPFKGKHNGLSYPEAYGDDAKVLFEGHAEAGKKTVFNFKGVPCKAGHQLLRMEPDGTLMRCPGDKTILGNVNTRVLLPNTAPCRVERCPCRGLDHVVLTPVRKRFAKGVQYGVVGDNETSREAFHQVLEINEEHAPAINNLGVLAWRYGDRERARYCFDKAAGIMPNEVVIAENLKQIDESPEMPPAFCNRVKA